MRNKFPVVCYPTFGAGLLPFLRKTRLYKDENKQQHASRQRYFFLNNPVVKKHLQFALIRNSIEWHVFPCLKRIYIYVLWEEDCGFLSASRTWWDFTSDWRLLIRYQLSLLLLLLIYYITIYYHTLLYIMVIMYHYSISINNNKQ